MTREMRAAPSRFWRDDRGLSIFLAALVAMIVVPALGPVGLPGRLLGDALLALMLVSGAAAVTDRPRAVLVVSVLSIPARGGHRPGRADKTVMGLIGDSGG